MQSKPTTEQILNDLAREVKESFLPTVSDPTQKVNFEMMEQLLRACAKRSAHEIAWMKTEADEIEKALHLVSIYDSQSDDERNADIATIKLQLLKSCHLKTLNLTIMSLALV